MPSATTHIADILAGYRYQTTTEAFLQEGIAEVLKANEVEFEREYRLGPRERIDFYIESEGVGIEVKVDGSTNAVARQVARYAASDRIASVIVVTTLVKHRNLPPKLNGKEVRTVFTGRGAL